MNFTFKEKQLQSFEQNLKQVSNEKTNYETLTLTKDHNITTANIMLTEQCSFRCTYCYEKFTDDIIEDETLKQTIEFLYSSKEDKVSFWIFGGEITTVPEKVFLAAKYIKQVHEANNKGKKIDVIFFTNGFVFEEQLWLDVRKELIGIPFFVQISFDGLHEMNNARKTIAGNYTEQIVIDNIKLFNRIVPVIVRSTISSQSFKPGALLDTVKYFESIKVAQYAINIVQEEHWNSEIIEQFLTEMSQIADWLIDFYTTHPYTSYMVFPFHSIFIRDHYSKKCGVGYNFTAINTKGKLNPCHVLYSHAKKQDDQNNDYWGHIGDVFNGVSEQKIEKWKRLSTGVDKPLECSVCPSTVCNMCPAVSITQSGTLKRTYRQGYCVLMKRLQKIMDRFKTRMEQECQLITPDGNWALVFKLWQHVINQTPTLNKQGIQYLTTEELLGASEDWVLYRLKKALTSTEQYQHSTLLEILNQFQPIADLTLDSLLVHGEAVYNVTKKEVAYG